ncbi:MAG: chorismate lyase [Gammaproteobacteria bacterium]
MKHPGTSSWFRPNDIFSKKLDPAVISWLADQGSLTKRLMEYCPGQFSVRVLSQQWVIPEIDEARILNIPYRQTALLRQVQLLCGDMVCVYARSIIPLKTLGGRHRRLRFLGDRPLGAYLFANPSLQRNQQQLASIAKKDTLFDIATAGSDQDCAQIWGRRSLFTIDEKPLLVSEYFLPALFEKNEEASH